MSVGIAMVLVTSRALALCVIVVFPQGCPTNVLTPWNSKVPYSMLGSVVPSLGYGLFSSPEKIITDGTQVSCRPVHHHGWVARLVSVKASS